MKIQPLLLAILTLILIPTISIGQSTQGKKVDVLGEVSVSAQKANSDPIYIELKNLSKGDDAFNGRYAIVRNLILQKDAAIFKFRNGEIYFLKEAQGKKTGAVFIGDGEMSLVPPVKAEKRMLNYFAGSESLKEEFSQLVMFFTDKTFEEVSESPGVEMGSSGPNAGKARDLFRSKEAVLKNRFRANMAARTLMDIYSTPKAGFFTTFIKGKKYNELLFMLDPLGIPRVSPEQVMLMDYSAKSGGIWTAFHLAEEYKKGTATSSQDRRVFDLVKHEIDIAVRGTKLIATDKVTIKSLISGHRVYPFDLYRTLRIKRIIDDTGNTTKIIQEGKNESSGFSVILPKAMKVGKEFTMTFEYEGPEAIGSRGSGNYYLHPAARSTWYPNNGGTQFGDRAKFDINFRFPKNMTMIGVGERIGDEKVDGDYKTATWSTNNTEMAVAGFNYGDFKRFNMQDKSTGYNLEVWVNKDVPDEIKALQNLIERYESKRTTAADRGLRNAQGYSSENRSLSTGTNLRSISTSGMAKYVLDETLNSTRIYDAYFGRLPFKRIAVTQQPFTNFGQAWASLIYLPYPAFVGESQRKQLLGSFGGSSSFWRQVTAHEVAHQWWGHSAGWSSYHDQWMSEGFSQLSTSLYIQFVKKDLKQFNEFWEGERSLIVKASPATKGIKPYTVGPVTQGYRLNSGKTGRVARYLIYPKGGYILHMLRMLMTEKRGGDAKFQAMMRDFIATHYNQDVSTEDFKRAVEKHITPKMDIDKNGKMDWFFDQWVYGTEVPAYKLKYKIKQINGKSVLTGGITQSGVSDNFAMPVPLYLDFGSGWVSVGSVTIVGNKTFDLGNIPLPRKPKKVAICALSDILATSIENSGG